MYKIVTENNKVYSYVSDNLNVICINIPEKSRLDILAKAANYRFGERQHYLNKVLLSMGVMQAESLVDKYKAGDGMLPKYLRVVKQEQDDNNVKYNKPKDLIGVG